MINNNQIEQNKKTQPQKENISEQATASSQEKTTPSNKFSQDTYFALSSAQFEKLKLISETVFKLANKVLLDVVQQKTLTET